MNRLKIKRIMITLLLIIPLIGSLALLPLDEKNPNSRSWIKQIALLTSVINLFVSILLWVLFDSNCSQYQFVEEFNQLTFCHFYVGIDGISLYFVLMTTIITPICILSSWEDIQINLKYYLILFLVLETLQIAVFVVLDLLLFYIFFESVLIPLFLIIGIWGASESRIRASFLLFLYTLFGSLWMLLAIMVIFNNIGSTDLQLISLSEINLDSQKLLWLSLSFSKRNMTDGITKKNNVNTSKNLLEKFPQSNRKYLPENRKCKDLVVFGSNLSSTVKYPRYTSIVRHMIDIPYNLNSILFGILISDGWLFINKANNTLFAFKQSLSKFTYV
jgi:hypothetical protein